MAFNTTTNDRDFNLRYIIKPFENNDYNNIIYQNFNPYMVPFFGNEHLLSIRNLEDAYIPATYEAYANNSRKYDNPIIQLFKNDRFHQMSQDDAIYYNKDLDNETPLNLKKRFQKIYSTLNVFSFVPGLVFINWEGADVESLNRERFVIRDKLVRRFCDPNNDGFLLNGAMLGMIMSSRFKVTNDTENKVRLTQEGIHDGNKGTEYWSNVYEESIKMVEEQGYYILEKLPFYKALSQLNDRCLLADTIAKILWKQPRSAKLHGNKSITDDMIKLDRIIDDRHGFSMEFGNLINNAMTCEVPISPDVQKSLLKLNKRITAKEYTPNRADYTELLDNCIKVTKSMPREKRTDISYKYKGRSKPAESRRYL